MQHLSSIFRKKRLLHLYAAYHTFKLGYRVAQAPDFIDNAVSNSLAPAENRANIGRHTVGRRHKPFYILARGAACER